MKLYNLVHAKTGYISPEQWHEALQQAKKANRTGFSSKAQQLQYIADYMAVWIINKDLKGAKGNEKV